MIWVAWRRHRLMVAIVGGLLIALAVWMIVIEHGFRTAAVLNGENRCPVGFNHLRDQCTGDQTQATVIELVLLALPCAVGVVLGGPLIAGELHGNTNRLGWTQGISRTRWFVTKWLLVAVALFVSTALFQVLANWWRSRINGDFGLGLGITGIGPGSGFGRIQPGTFAMTGIVPVAYVLFAFALSATLGAVIRRTSWAIAGTVVLYAGAALLMVFFIRPNVLPQSFAPFGTSAGSSSGSATAFLQSGNAELTTPWFISSGYRYDTGYKIPPGAPSANDVGQQCEDHNYNYTPFLKCLSNHGLQEGQFFQPARHYWPLQWIEAGIYVFASVLLFGAGLWSIRRWRA